MSLEASSRKGWYLPDSTEPYEDDNDISGNFSVSLSRVFATDEPFRYNLLYGSMTKFFCEAQPILRARVERWLSTRHGFKEQRNFVFN